MINRAYSYVCIQNLFYNLIILFRTKINRKLLNPLEIPPMIHFCVYVLMLQAEYSFQLHILFSFYYTIGSIENLNYYIYVAEFTIGTEQKKC